MKLKAKIDNIIRLKLRCKFLTENLPCVNLFVKIKLKNKIAIYNNSDLIIMADTQLIDSLLSFNDELIDLVLYCLCLKHSINRI